MPRHISIVFPGQGSQALKMLDSFDGRKLKKYDSVIAKSIGFDLIDIIRNGPEKILNNTSITQPAILFTSYIHYKNIIEKHNIRPNLFAGHSLGEYSALTCSDSISLEDALKLVYNRGLLMEKAKKGSMYAIINFDFLKIKEICNDVELETNQIVSPANINSNTQIVIAGNIKATELAVKRLKKEGAKRCIKLKVSVASHCKLMKRTASFFIKDLNKIELKMPQYEVLHNVNAKVSDDIETLKYNLTQQLVEPVKWNEIMKKISSYSGIVIECGPGKILTTIAKSNGINNVISSSSSAISRSNSSSKAITNSTVSSESAPRSSTNEESLFTSSSPTPSCSQTIFLTLSSILTGHPPLIDNYFTTILTKTNKIISSYKGHHQQKWSDR